MADWNHDDQSRGGPRESSRGGERDWRGGRDWRDRNDGGLLESRYGGEPGREDPRAFDRSAFDRDRVRQAGDPRRARDEHARQGGRGDPASQAGGALAGQRPGEGGDNASGQMTSGSSDSGLGGYGGADVGGWGQPNLNSQWGRAGYGPLNQGLDYGQDGGRFGPAGYDPAAYGGSPQGAAPKDGPHDPHHASYHHWRNTQLSSHDRDYARWREEQVRRYDEDYGSWRNERHSAFSKEFEGWRAGRGGQAGVPASAQPATSAGAASSSTVINPSEGSVYGQVSAKAAASGEASSAHGANPTLGRIADGDDGRHHPHDRADADKPTTRN